MEILIAILALSFLIIVHEFGHFIVAKLSGIKVLEFALFMGPKLFSIQKGETMYSLRLIPLGGYVRMEGEEAKSDDDRAFNKKPILTRAAVVVAGPIMNLIVAILLLAIVFAFTGYSTNKLSVVTQKSPAAQIDLRPGDKVISYDGKKVYDIMDLVSFLYVSKGKPAEIEIMRGEEKLNKVVVPEVYPEQDKYLLGFSPKASEGTESNVVENISKDSPAGKAGLMQNDRIVRLNDKKVVSRQDINDYLKLNKDALVNVTVSRDGKEVSLGTVRPILQKISEQYVLGIDFANVKGGAIDTIKHSFISSYALSRQMYYSIIWLSTKQVSFKNVMGPVGIVNSIGQVVEGSPGISYAILNLMKFTALISINLGLFNLIPFPALDGSKLLLFAVEGVRRKPLSPEKEAAITMVGFAILIALMIFTTSNDIIRLFKG